MARPLGLNLLSEGTSSVDRGVDIIAVHGLNGQACWKPQTTKHGSTQDGSQSSFWLRDWLPADIPTARVFAYNFVPSPILEARVFTQAADRLLDELKTSRAGKIEEPRPLLFICHSLGGLVVKCALTRAFHNRGDERLSQIITTTQGIIFLGTPHSTPSSDLQTTVDRITIGSETTEFTMVAIRSMKHILNQFVNLPWSSLPWHIVSFYEELPLPGSDFKAVDRSQTELWTFPQVSLHKDHHDMCRFTSGDDPSYLKILESVRNITLSSRTTDHIIVNPNFSKSEHEVLRGLAVEDMSINIGDAYKGTCDWILEDLAFKSWSVEEPSQILWVKGKAGSGKSTLMKHIINDLPKRTVDSTLKLHFFFSRHGKNRSVTSLLRSLLYQLLNSTLSSRSFDVFASLAEDREMFGADSPWDDDLLTDYLFQLMDKSTGLGTSVLLFVDALDECEDPGGVISLLLRINSSKPSYRVRTCLSSRSNPPFTPAREIHLEDKNFSDIQRYITDKLSASQNSYPSALDVQSFAPIIAKKAQGVFLWARLVISDVIRESFLKPFEVALNSTWWLPMDLAAAYETVMERLWSSHDVQYRRAAEDALILVLCVRRPLSTLELREALAIVNSGHDRQGTKWPQDKCAKWEDMHARVGTIPLDPTTQLMVLCGGLLEISPQPPKSANGSITMIHSTVRFIHESARDFLLKDTTFAMEETHESRDREAYFHFRVAQTCLEYIDATATSSQRSVASKANSHSYFLGYAITNAMHHLSSAAWMGVKPKREGLWLRPHKAEFIDHWVTHHNEHFRNQNLFKPHKTKAAHIMSYFGLPWLETGLWGASLADINEPDHFGQTPLSLAAAMGHYDVCRFLIERGANLGHRDHIYGQTPLGLAASHGHSDVVEALLQAGSDYNDHTSGDSVLNMAVCSGHLSIVKLLLDAGANVTLASVHTGEAPLSRAAARGHIPIVSLLLESGAKLENWDKRGWTPLHHAVSKGRKKTLEMLLEGLKPDQFDTLRVGLAKAKGSWVNAVVRAIILGLYLCRDGESQTTSYDSYQKSKTQSVPSVKRNPAMSNRKRGRHKLDLESDEDDWDGEDKDTSGKRARHSDLNGLRFACPYHRKNAVKYSRGACNGKGFEDIYRLRHHVMKCHSRVEDLQRCHICKERFAHAKISGHAPCVQRAQASDYEDGFDAVQLQELKSKDMFPGKSSGEKCWYKIFKVLFPTWPKTEGIPSPYQGEQYQPVQPCYRQAVAEFGKGLTSPDTISEMMNSVSQGQGEQGLRQILERLLGGLTSRFGISSTALREEPDRILAPDSVVVPQLLSATQSGLASETNTASSTASPQVAPASQNAGETASSSIDISQGSCQYLPQPEQSIFRHTPSSSYNGSSNLHNSTLTSSNAYSYLLDPDLTYEESDAITNNTNYSDYVPNDQHGWQIPNGNRLLAYARSNSNPGHSAGVTLLTCNQDTAPRHVRTDIPADSAPQWPTLAGFGQSRSTQLDEVVYGGDNEEQGTIADPSQVAEDHEPSLQAPLNDDWPSR